MKTKNILLASAFLVVATVATSFAQNNLGASCGCPPVNTRPLKLLNQANGYTDASLNFTATNTILRCDTTYVLIDKSYVGNGKSITIQPGTVVKGEPETTPGSSRDGGVLVISRGAKIFAAGTESCPIVFTTTLDPMDGTYGIANKGKWGGVVICGKATNNLTDPTNTYVGVNGKIGTSTTGVGFIEGFTSIDSRIYYGAGDAAFPTFDDNDNSGILTYVSMRHGGEIIGAANEINGLTLGAVGRGTTIHHVEVVSNLDDGFEMFGGTVDLKYCSVLFNDDDGFDWDINWSGRGQFLCVIKTDQSTAAGGDNGFESDGDDNKLNAPSANQSNPQVYNMTFVGSNGINGSGATHNGVAIQCKEQTNGTIRNGIFANYRYGLNLMKDPTRPGPDAYDYWLAGTLKVECNTFLANDTLLYKFKGTAYTGGSTPVLATDSTKFFADKNLVVGSIGGFDFTHSMNTSTNVVSDVNDLIPSTGDAGLSTAGCPVAPVDGFFVPTTYRGAFEPGKKSWLSNYSINALIDLQDNLIPCPTDLNTDGTTNTSDFLILLGSIGTSCD